MSEGVGANPAAPFNSFSHARALAGPKDTFVTINNDTVYSMAQLDLSVGPVALHVPDTDGRYYVLQFVDAWTDNFAYVGHRATGTGEGDFLLVPPGWAGEPPAGHTVIHLADAGRLDRGPLGRGQRCGPAGRARPAGRDHAHPLDTSTVPDGLAIPDPTVPDDIVFLEKLRVWSQQFPPADRDQPLQQSLAPLGVTAAGDSPYASLAEDDRASLASLAHAQQVLHQALVAGHSPEMNGWKLTFHAFDYNLDFFEVGASTTTGSRSPTRSCGSWSARPRPLADCGATTPTRPPTS